MDALAHFLRNQTWLAIGVSAAMAVVLAGLKQWQMCALLASIASALLMWRSELDHPRAPDEDEA